MKAVIITVGNEILNGRTVNTNFSFIAKMLTYSGYTVARGIIVPDTIEGISNAFTEASRIGDVIVSSGGLGPTFDDITVAGFSQAFGLKLSVNEVAMEMIKPKFNRLTPEREKMAIMPENSMPIRNDAGTAPGVYMKIENKAYIILPGVPREVESIMKNIIGEIRLDNFVYCDRSFEVSGVMESVLAPFVRKLMSEYNNAVYIKTHPKGNEVKSPLLEIEVTAGGTDKNIEKTVDEVIDKIKKHIDENDY